MEFPIPANCAPAFFDFGRKFSIPISKIPIFSFSKIFGSGLKVHIEVLEISISGPNIFPRFFE